MSSPTTPHSASLPYLTDHREKPLPPMPPGGLDANPRQQRPPSWVDHEGTNDNHPDLDYLLAHPSAALPPSPYSPNSSTRPAAPTPTPSDGDTWSPDHKSQQLNIMAVADQFTSEHSPPPSATSVSGSPKVPYSLSHNALARSFSEGEASLRSFARPPKVLPDPSQFPDPYPVRTSHSRISERISSALPSLSSAGSSSASTRSSAYTSSGSALAFSDHGHVAVANGDEEIGVAVGIATDDEHHLLPGEGSLSAAAGRTPIDQARWSEYSASIRSRSSSIGYGNTGSLHEAAFHKMRENHGMGWQPVDERDEVGLTSEEDTDDVGDDDEELEKGEERTSAVVVAEEGRGLIVKGDGIPVVQLQIEPGTTHLLIGSSSTPNALPAFLTNNLPPICSTLLALDISTNFLVAIPPILAQCVCLEELNIASNPLRVLPVFLSQLVSLRVLIADATGISSLPDCLCELEKLTTLSIRRNKLHSLPSWLCLLPSLQEFYLDSNPFQGPWQALVEPLLAKAPVTSLYPPSTPIATPTPSFLESSASADTDTDEDGDDEDYESDPPSAAEAHGTMLSPEDETITSARAPMFGRALKSPSMSISESATDRGLVRTRTAPNRSPNGRPRPKTGHDQDMPKSPRRPEDSGYYTDHDIRKMKSASELRAKFDVSTPSPEIPPQPPLGSIRSSASSSNLLASVPSSPEADRVAAPKRYASLGVASALSGGPSRPSLSQAFDDLPQQAELRPAFDSNEANRVSTATATPPRPVTPGENHVQTSLPPERQKTTRAHHGKDSKEGKEKTGRWGFLKKMSMGKMRPDPPAARPSTVHGRVSRPEASSTVAHVPALVPGPTSPQIDVRFSTTGSLGGFNASTPSVPSVQEGGTSGNDTPTSMHGLTLQKSSSVGNLLNPSSPVPRSARRRSFLPVDGSGVPSLNTPSDISLASQLEDPRGPITVLAPTVPSNEFSARREEDRAREAYTRALRSVMAYLKDMNDLTQNQGNTLSIYGDDITGRSRRPTILESRQNSENSIGLISRANSQIGGQLRSPDAMASLRADGPSQTASVVTMDSDGSSEERKYKDDKSQRSLIVREIIETERTYVKGLQGLVDIYIRPSTAPVNLISNVGTNKETTIPAAERKIVFGGVEALFSFHKESFLPALEAAADPVMRKASTEGSDPDGQLSINVVKAVADIFMKHAAFMKMYSSYINNFDNAVQRIKYWSSDRPNTGNSTPSGTLSPSSSTAQLVNMGLVTAPVMPHSQSETSSGNMPSLSSSQRKRIKQFLKRCRLNPKHTQLNLEGYLLLPIQRIPRYRLLLEQLLKSTPPTSTFADNALDRALVEISSLANNMNEGKRESESRRKLVLWQARIRGKFPSPLVQPHRRLIMDGPLLLTRVVRKTIVSFESFNAQGDASSVQVECLSPELTPRPLVGILCNDLLVLCRDTSDGKDPNSYVDLWAVLRMQTLPQPASIVHGNALRLVDNKAILYFDAPSPSDALNWFRAINLHIPASKT